MPEEQEMTLEQLQQMADEHDSAVMEIPPAEEIQKEEVQETPEPTPEPEKPPPMADSPPSQKPVASEDEGSLKNSEGLSKVDKAEARQNRAWQKINSAKEDIAREREELLEMRSRLNQSSPREQYLDERGLSAKDYEEVAESYMQEGNLEGAEDAKKRASEVRMDAEKQFSDDVDNSFKEACKNNFNAAAKEYPDLNNQESEFSQKVQGLIIEKPVLATYTGGISDAADIIGMRTRVENSSGLQSQVDALQSENDNLKSKLFIGGSAPADRPTQKGFNELSDKDQFAELQRMAAAADARSP